VQRHFVKPQFLLFLLFFSVSFSIPQTWAIQAVMTHNVFYAPDQNTLKPYVEIYWEIDPNTLLYNKTDNSWKGKIKTDITLSKNGTIVTEEHYILETLPISDVKMLYHQRIMDLRRFALDTGSYQLKVVLTDVVNKGNAFDYNKNIVLNSTQKPFFSDIQLVDTCFASTEKNNYQRNNTIQIPLASNFFDENRKLLNYYAELYQPTSAPNAAMVKVFISKKENEFPLHNLIDTFSVQQQKINIIAGKLNLATLASGNYFVNTALCDSDGKAVATQSLFFQMLNPHPVVYNQPKDTTKKDSTAKPNQPTYINLNKTYLSKYTPGQIRLILKMLVPIADPTERLNIGEFLKSPNDVYSRYFIYNFWTKRNSKDPEAAWKAYAEKVKYTNREFNASMLRGFESDRGRIFLEYGAPTERIKVENEDGANPYEIWQYNVLNDQANVLFLFCRTGFVGSDYRLIHTTYAGEKSNRKWRLDVYINGNATSSNSRAEQYFGNR
jgi:GWxTD domain-containing protein